MEPVEPTLQVPVELQVVFDGTLLAQLPAQAVPDVANRQVCAVPEHPPGAHTTSFPDPAAQTLRGSCPVGTSEQVPFDADSAQYWHVPLHAVEQQTPSTQCALASVPFWHSLLVVQVEPIGFLPHELPVQTLPAEHSAPPLVHVG